MDPDNGNGVDRRGFLRGLGAGLAGVSLSPVALEAANAASPHDVGMEGLSKFTNSLFEVVGVLIDDETGDTTYRFYERGELKETDAKGVIEFLDRNNITIEAKEDPVVFLQHNSNKKFYIVISHDRDEFYNDPTSKSRVVVKDYGLTGEE